MENLLERGCSIGDNVLRLCAGGALKHEIVNPPLMFN